MFRHFEPSNLIMVYLLGVVVTATRWGRWPSLLAALLSVAAFDFFFVPPYFSFAVAETQYLVVFAVMAIVAILISALTATIREQAEVSRQRERRTSALYALSRELAASRNIDSMLSAVQRNIEAVFQGRIAVFMPAEGGRLDLRSPGSVTFAKDLKEAAVAQWAYDHTQPAGRGTGTLSSAEALHIPLVGGKGPVGVLAIHLDAAHPPLDTEQMHLLETFANQAALAFERETSPGDPA